MENQSITIYEGFTPEELDLIKGQTHPYIRSSISYDAYSDAAKPNLDWATIFVPWLMGEGREIQINTSKVYMKQADLDYYYPTNPTSSKNELYGTIKNISNSNYQIRFYHTGTGIKVYNYLDAVIREESLGYTNHPEIALALTQHQNHKVKVIHKEHSIQVYTNEITEQLIQSVVALIPYILNIPDLKENPEIDAICKAVSKNKPIKPYFTNILETLTELKKTAKHTVLVNMLNKNRAEQIENTRSLISDVERDIHSAEERLEKYFNRLQELNALLIGQQALPKADLDSVQELINYIENHRYIKGFTTTQQGYYNRDALRVRIQAPITLYEKEPLRRTMNACAATATPRTLLLYKAFNRIFLKEEYQLICETVVDIDPIGNTWHAANEYDMGSSEKMYNPHLALFNCWGDNRTAIYKDLSESNIIGVINTILIAVQNINFTDSAVFNRWINNLREYPSQTTKASFLDKQTGELKTLQEIIDIAKEDEIDFEEEEETL